jgi:anti-anti-sigma factor
MIADPMIAMIEASGGASPLVLGPGSVVSRKKEGVMAMDIFHRICGDVVVFDIIGDFTRMERPTPTLHERVSAELAAGKRKVLLNFKRAGFVDSEGVGQIIASFTSAQRLGGGLKLCSVPKKLLVIFKVIGLVPHVLSVYPDEATGLESFGVD